MSAVVECPICMDQIEGEKNKVTTECGHCFHTSCLMKNVVHNGFGCPYCRDAMADEPADNNSDEEYDEFSVDEEDEDTQYETDESSSDNEVSEEKVSESVSSVNDNVKSESSKESEPVVVEEVVVPKKEEPVSEEKPFIGIDDLMDDKALKKMPTASIKKLDLGTVMLGGDGKTKYIVALNKSGKKYWKRN